MRLAPLLLALLSAAPLGAAQEEAGAVAPPNRWTTRGGSASRTGVTSTAPLLGPVEIGWEVELPGEVEGEPLVWDEHVVVAVRESARTRSLHVLDLASGEPVAPPRSFRTRLPLAPSLWHDTVLVRADERLLEASRIAPGRLYAVWQLGTEAQLGPPLLVGNEVFVATEKKLFATWLGETDLRWSERGSFRGHVSLRGERVWAVKYDTGGQAWLMELQRSNGRVLAQVPAGSQGKQLPGIEAEPTIAVHDRLLILQHAPPPGGQANAGGRTVWLDDWRASRVQARQMDLLTETTTWNGGWLGVLRDPSAASSRSASGSGAAVLGLQDPGANRVQVLARAGHHAEFVTPPLAVSRARDVAYVGARAFDLDSRRILWELPVSATQRAVPARGAVLVLASPSRLVAVRARRLAAVRDVHLDVRVEDGPLRVTGARAVLAGGSWLEGELELDTRAQSIAELRNGRVQETWPLSSALLFEDGAGRLRFARGPEDAVRAVEILIDADLARRYAELAGDAAAAGDAVLGERLLQEAIARGASELEVQRVRSALDGFAGRPRRADAYRTGRIEAAERELAGLPAAAWWKRAASLSPGAPLSLRAALLRALLLAEPGHAGAVGAVRALLPGGSEDALGRRVAVDPIDWLDFVLAVHESPLAIVPPPTGGGDTWSQRRLRAAQRSWRADLVGLESEHLLILTSVERPGALARCLSMGELVCRALEDTFGASGLHGDRTRALELRLFESRDEYLRHSRNGGPAHGVLEETAGHYDPVENVSRIYLPAGEDAFARVQQVYAHELAHHWVRVQCPLFTPEEATAARPDVAGFWIVEGFAKLVEEFRFDLVDRRWETSRRDATSLTAVATLTPEELLPWELVLRATQEQFTALNPKPHTRMPLPGYLGRESQLSQLSCYYLQAGAVCQYLYHAENGRLRPRLLAYLRAFYTGRANELDVERAFGMKPDELGRRVVAFAKATVAR